MHPLLRFRTNALQKRKAQNRAAQRAFRERKEKHLKDLETKVNELSKTHEADKHENGLLKAQVERLQIELKEYRKRLSLNGGSSARGSPPLTAYTGQGRSNSGPNSANSTNSFQFDFPKFGALPGSQIFGNQNDVTNNGVMSRGSMTPPQRQSPFDIANSAIGVLAPQVPAQVQRTDSQSSQNARSLSPRTTTPAGGSNSNAATPPDFSNSFPVVGHSTIQNMHGFASTLPQMNDNPFGDLFSPSLLKNANFDNSNSYFGNAQQSNAGGVSLSGFEGSSGGESTAGLNRVFQFNSGSSASDSASPSASSTSQWNANANSSCGTSPEPSHGSPANKAQNTTDSYSADKANPLRSYSTSTSGRGEPSIALTGSNLNYNAMASDQTFDPVLFGDYRENVDASFGGTDFTNGGFFDDALNPATYDYGSPSNLFGILQSPQQTNQTLNVNNNKMPVNVPTPSNKLMEQIEKARDGGDEDYGLPVAAAAKPAVQTKDKNGKLISCNNIW
jgi:AP-1-like transcription factor